MFVISDGSYKTHETQIFSYSSLSKYFMGDIGTGLGKGMLYPSIFFTVSTANYWQSNGKVNSKALRKHCNCQEHNTDKYENYQQQYTVKSKTVERETAEWENTGIIHSQTLTKIGTVNRKLRLFLSLKPLMYSLIHDL